MPKLSADLNGVVNKELTQVTPSGIRSFDAEISKVPGIVKLTIGEPDLNVPEHVKEAAIDSIKNNDSHYSAQAGTMACRKAIAGFVKRTRGVDYDPENEIVVTIGATEALSSTFGALLNAGDKVIVPTPVWSLYFPLIELSGAEAVQVDTEADGYVLTPELLEKVLAKEGPKVKGVLINYPNNPTGREYPTDVIRGLAKVISDHHLFVVADEIYSSLIYGDVKHLSFASVIPERTILVSGLSKSHAMTGWRLGYLCGPADIVKNVAKMHSLRVTSPNDTAMAAATEALNNGDEDPVQSAAIYKKRRDYLYQALQDAGMETVSPDGAFYLFAKIPASYGKDDVKFATDLAKVGKVGCVPGSAFGAGGKGHVRFSYAASDDDIHLAADRIKKFVASLK